MNSEYDVVGYWHWDDAKQFEYVFCVECVEDQALNVDQDKRGHGMDPISEYFTPGAL